MRIGRVVLWTLLLVPQPIFGSGNDIIIMRNGDRLTGEVKYLDEGVLYVRLGYILGTSSVDWSQVVHVESKRLFIVKTENGSIYKGRLNTANTDGNRPVSIEIVGESESQAVVKRSQIVAVFPASTVS